MLELIIVISLCLVAILFSLWLIGYGMRRLDDYKGMTEDDYQQLRRKARLVNKVHQSRKKDNKCRKEQPYRSTIPCLDHDITY